MSWPVTRTLLPERRTLPSRINVTPNSCAICFIGLVVPRYDMTEVRETTRSSRTSARFVRMSSCMPSVKKALSLSSLMLVNGSTAMDLSDTRAVVSAGGAILLSAGGTAGGTDAGSDFRQRNTRATTAPMATAPTPQAHVGIDFLVSGVADPGFPVSARPAPAADCFAPFLGSSSSFFTCPTNCGVGTP